MSAGLVLYDDARARTFEPFALTRPISSLVTGTTVVAERWRTALQVPVDGAIVADHLGTFDETPRAASGTLAAGTIVANARFAPAMEVLAQKDGRSDSAWSSGGRVAAVRLTRPMPVSEFADGTLALESLMTGSVTPREIAGWWHDEVWDFIRHLQPILSDDIARLNVAPVRGGERRWAPPPQVTILGDHPVVVHDSSAADSSAAPAVIEPQVVLDASGGPILIESGATVRAFTRISGPCRIGPGTTIMGGDVTGCSIGRTCRIRGEISSTVVLGFSNKGHEGFVGHSYLGRWVNLGAGTTTSNLKNTYGTVALWTPDGIRDTGLQFLGTLFGDHAKTGIGMVLTTGTVVGAGANVYGTEMPPKAVPPFAWGDGEPYGTYQVEKFLTAAERMMARRHETLTDRMKEQLRASFERRHRADRAGTVAARAGADR